MHPLTLAFDEYDIFQLPTEKVACFVVATTGDGDPPTTMKAAWAFLLRKDLPPKSLQSLRFTVFGLGDSSYLLFNAMAKKLTQRLLDLGATLFHQVALGDYQHDFEYEAEFDPWAASLWPKLIAELPSDRRAAMTLEAPEESTLLPHLYNVTEVESPSKDAKVSGSF